ncbi:MAG: hypothetical protein Q4G39_06800 [Brachymonas sp.]|nr:hypothetical protein [Brachymonas sp.]
MIEPSTTKALNVKQWFVVVLAISVAGMPVLVFIPLLRHVYPFSHVHLWLVKISVLCSVPLGIWLYRRDKAVPMPGVPRRYAKRLKPREYVMVALGLPLVLYVFFLSLVVLAMWWPGRALVEQAFVVATTSECNSRCGGCYYRAHLEPLAPGLLQQQSLKHVCVEHLKPLQDGNHLVLRGRFSSLGVYVQSVHRKN